MPGHLWSAPHRQPRPVASRPGTSEGSACSRDFVLVQIRKHLSWTAGEETAQEEELGPCPSFTPGLWGQGYFTIEMLNLLRGKITSHSCEIPTQMFAKILYSLWTNAWQLSFSLLFTLGLTLVRSCL